MSNVRRRMRGIVVDLDDTLLDERAATRSALEAFLTVTRSAWQAESEAQALARWRKLSADHWLRFEQGHISFEDQRRARVREFLRIELSDSEADRAFEPYRTAYEASWSLFPECQAFLKRTASIPKVIVTNGERSQQLRKVKATGLLEHVLGVVTPMDCGHWKPRPEIFLAALAILQLSPGECLMIGDDAVRDIEPAMRLGMKCFQVQYGNPYRSLLQAVPDA